MSNYRIYPYIQFVAIPDLNILVFHFIRFSESPDGYINRIARITGYMTLAGARRSTGAGDEALIRPRCYRVRHSAQHRPRTAAGHRGWRNGWPPASRQGGFSSLLRHRLSVEMHCIDLPCYWPLQHKYVLRWARQRRPEMHHLEQVPVPAGEYAP
jgi:hypothetical protein